MAAESGAAEGGAAEGGATENGTAENGTPKSDAAFEGGGMIMDGVKTGNQGGRQAFPRVKSIQNSWWCCPSPVTTTNSA